MAGIHIGIIGNRNNQVEKSEDEIDKHIINKLFAGCCILNRDKIDIEKLINIIRQKMNNEKASIHEALMYFDALNEDEMNNIIIECTTEKAEKKAEIHLSNIVDDSKTKPMHSDFFKHNQTRKFGMPMDNKELQREQRKAAFGKTGKANSSRKRHK